MKTNIKTWSFSPTTEVSKALEELQACGCQPSIYARGSIWRAHINYAGNYWAEDTTPLGALCSAIDLWEADGCPMDGGAVLNKNLRD